LGLENPTIAPQILTALSKADEKAVEMIVHSEKDQTEWISYLPFLQMMMVWVFKTI
jgi:hypothetical protein